MLRDQQDPTILDLIPERSLESQRPKNNAAADGPPLSEDPAYVKYIRMLKMVRSLVICPRLLVFRASFLSSDVTTSLSATGHTHRCCKDSYAT
jgi:hypothetical protein